MSSEKAEVHLCGYCGQFAVAIEQLAKRVSHGRDVDGYGQKQQHYKRRLFACSKHAIDAPIDGALNKTRAPAPRNNPRGPAFDASAKAFKNDGPVAP